VQDLGPHSVSHCIPDGGQHTALLSWSDMTARDMQGLQLYSLSAQHRHAVKLFLFGRGGERANKIAIEGRRKHSVEIIIIAFLLVFLSFLLQKQKILSKKLLFLVITAFFSKNLRIYLLRTKTLMTLFLIDYLC
jgi:hypothetical protein